MRDMRNPVIKGVVLEVDSFGGEFAGAFETADLIAREAQDYRGGEAVADRARQPPV